MSFSFYAQPGGLPGTPGDADDNTTDVPEAPIDSQIWLGLIGGVAIGGYLLMKKHDNNIA
ncbi:hypothetical protein [Psychroflexus aestuariivivens]|uniref:hypothetical protein n=1 Tax=Psychroflexus aestuariivivens TaxID=1795040 RepID=UPI000FD9F2AE|nr:hypothetical protein [Psychroflexus aestuariivivens]